MRSRSSWVLLVSLAGCSRCNDHHCLDGECVTYDPTTSTGEVADTSTDDGVTSETSDAVTGDGGTAPATSTTGTIDDGQCQGTDECSGEFCVAPYADNVRGDFDCVAECVGPMDESKWCFDDAACCDAAAHCTIRGYCEVEGESTSDTGSAGDTGTSSGTG